MVKITITDKDYNENNINYITLSLNELFFQTSSKAESKRLGSRSVLELSIPEEYVDLVRGEVYDKIADIITVNYKYEFFKKYIKPHGLNEIENELLLTSLIAADIEEDKRFSSVRLSSFNNIAIDGMYNFRLKALKKKWQEIVTYMPEYFINSQLKDFITYLLEDKKKRVYVDGEKVYDMHYHRLTRGELMNADLEEGKIIREIILSGCGEVELGCKLPKTDEFYLQEYFGDKVILTNKYFS